MKILPCLLLICAAALPLHAQTPSPSPSPSLASLPEGPLIRSRAADPSQWLIEAGTDKASPGAEKAAKPKTAWGSKVAVTKVGTVMLRQTLDDKGQPWNTWCFGTTQITISPDGKNVVVQTPNPDPTIPTPNYEDYSTTDFPGFEWVADDKYVGVEKVSGTDCLVFKMKRKIAADDPEPTDFAAYVDLGTRLPTALKVGGRTHTYTFLTTAPNSLDLPPNIKSIIEAQQHNRQASIRRAIRPY